MRILFLTFFLLSQTVFGHGFFGPSGGGGGGPVDPATACNVASSFTTTSLDPPNITLLTLGDEGDGTYIETECTAVGESAAEFMVKTIHGGFKNTNGTSVTQQDFTGFTVWASTDVGVSEVKNDVNFNTNGEDIELSPLPNTTNTMEWTCCTKIRTVAGGVGGTTGPI